MRYKKLGEVVSGNEDVIKCLADKFILIAENDDENCTKFYIVKSIKSLGMVTNLALISFTKAEERYLINV